MPCPPDLAAALTRILETGLVRCRAAAWANDAPQAALEADHLHNLPLLLRTFDVELLRGYWQLDRPAYLRRATPDASAAFAEAWTELGRWLETNARLGQVA